MQLGRRLQSNRRRRGERLHIAQCADLRVTRLPAHIGQLIVRHGNVVGLHCDTQTPFERFRRVLHITHKHERTTELSITGGRRGRKLDSSATEA